MPKLLTFTGLMLFSTAALAAPSVDSLIGLLIWLIVLGLIFYLLWWFVSFVGLPEPFGKVARVLIALIALVILLYFLLGVLGPIPSLR